MLAKFRLFKQNRKFYSNLVITILTISMIPMLIISIVSYYNIKLTVEKELINDNYRYLRQTANAIEIVMKQISDSHRQLLVDAAFRDFVDFPGSIYYENLHGEIDNKDLIPLAKYIDNKKSVFQKISALKFSNEYIDSVYFYDCKKNIILTDEGIQYSFNEFYDKDWFTDFKETNNSPVFIEKRNVICKNYTNKNVLTIIYKNSMGAILDFNSAFIINIDNKYIQENIIRKLDKTLDDNFFIVSQSGEILFKEISNKFHIKDNDVLYMNNYLKFNEDSFKQDFGGSKYLITYITSDALGWRFIDIKELRNFNKGILYIKYIIVITSASLLMLIFLFTIIFAKKIYNPIDNVLQFIKSKDIKMDEEIAYNSSIGEMKIIANSLQKAFNEKEQLQARLKESLPAYRNTFMLSLLKNKTNYSTEEMDKKLALLGIEIDEENFIVLVMAPAYKRANIDLKDVLLEKLSIIETVGNMLSRKYKGILIEDDDELIVVLNCSKDQISNIFVFAQELKDILKNKYNRVFTIGISKYWQYIFDLNNAYSEAKEALRYSILIGKDAIMYIGDIRINKGQSFVYKKELESSLCNFIKSGDKKNACMIFNEITNDIIEQRNKVDYYRIQQIFIQLFASLLNVANEVGIEWNKLDIDEGDFYNALIGKSENSIFIWFKYAIIKLSDCISNKMIEKNNSYVEAVISIISEECGDNICLDMIADKLNLSPSYISRIFKENTGKTFIEYLTFMRIEKSKSLLSETDLKIKEIGEKVGYNTSHYFIKLFKEQEGITPGEYRNLHKV